MKLAYFFISYPGKSQSFLHREISALAQHGFKIEIHSLLHTGPGNSESVPVGTTLHPFKVWEWFGAIPSILLLLVSRPLLFGKAFNILLKHPPRCYEHWRHTFLGFVFAMARSSYFKNSDVDHFHAAWATAPATAACILSCINNIPFSFGAQAYDIYRNGGDPLLIPKMKLAQFIHTTTNQNVEYLSNNCVDAAPKIRLIRRGLDKMPSLSTKIRCKLQHPQSDLPSTHVLSVARLIPKKGHFWQLEACKILKERGFAFRLKIVGDGPLQETLSKHSTSLNLNDSVEFCGHLPQAEVQTMYSWADIFWHTGIVDSEGDRDGLPNVVPEAMAHGLPVVSSQVGAVTEAVQAEVTGLIVDVTQPDQLATATSRLIKDPHLYERLAAAGRDWVVENFLSENNSKKMAEAFRESLPH